MPRGLVIVFTGNGKGKTTAALGMGLRSVGHHLPVLCIQFIKGSWRTGEAEAIARLAPDIEIESMGLGFTFAGARGASGASDEEHVAAAQAGLARAREAMASGRYRMIILDEILGAIKAGLVPLRDVLDLIAAKPERMHLVLTGRDAPPEIVDAADLVTEMRLIKHPFERGIPAQRGVEF